MDEVVSADPIVSRFEKVLRCYWDGIPVPLFVTGKRDTPMRTFNLRLLGFSPDYYGEVKSIELKNARCETVLFTPLSEVACVNSSMSSRIGSHYSPLVGLFKFSEATLRKGTVTEAPMESTAVVRVPATPCEDVTCVYTDSAPDYRRHVRMIKLIELYEPLVKEYARMGQSSLRRVVNLATQGLGASSKQQVVREICAATDEYAKWQCEAVFFYMCVDPLFRRIVEPLQVLDSPFPHQFSIVTLREEERRISQAHFREAKGSLQETRLWNRHSRSFFEAMQTCWAKKFKRLALFNLSLTEKMCRSGAFLEQITGSMRAALTKIRVEFYSDLEDFFFSYMSDAKDILTMDAEDLDASQFRHVFLAARVFAASKLRELLFENVERLFLFFNANGKGGRRLSPKVASKHPLLQVELVVGSRYEPRSPSFSHFRFGVLDLFDELQKSINGFPLPECAILRTLDLKQACIQVVDAVELAAYRASLMEVLDEVALTIDDMAQQCAQFADFPSNGAQVAKGGNFNTIRDFSTEIKKKLREVEVVIPDVVYAGCFAIVCTSVKKQYKSNWAQCQERFYKDYHALLSDAIASAGSKCVAALKAVEKSPRTVTELDEYMAAVKAAGSLAKRIRKVDCQDAIIKFNWMEELQIPVDPSVYQAALELMMWPARLELTADKSAAVKSECRPIFLTELDRLRTETRANIRTLTTGVTELYNMFNLEICDIAAQTCSELRELVDHIEQSVEMVRSQEQALGLPSADSFDDLPPLLNYFEIIEQFWLVVYKATGLRELHLTPISSLNAKKAIEDVREWRRLIHTATRSLRAYVPLARLGQQQELALAKFEELERLLHLLTTPGLRKSHWKEIGRLLAGKLVDEAGQIGDMTISLQKLIDARIADFVPDLERIASQARSDYEVEAKLEEMKSTAKRTYYQVVVVADEVVPRFALAPECRQGIHALIEQFVQCSRSLRRAAGLSPLVMKAVSEWEVSSERMRDTLLRWEAIDERWSSLSAFLFTLEKWESETARAPGNSQAFGEQAVMLDKLRSAAAALDTIYTTVSKPQFSLYMSIVQEAIAENLSLAKSAMDDVTVAPKDTFERMRAAFPRFNLVTDSQLATFLTPFNTKSLQKLLPLMYGHLRTVTVEEGCVTAFSTADGGTIPAATKLPLAHEPTELWMQRFDQCLTSSVYQAIYNCASEYGQTDIDVWMGNWCTQFIVMALRLTHTKEMRDAIQFAGAAGLRAYKLKLQCVNEELARLAIVRAVERGGKARTRLACAITYACYASKEVDLAMAHNVTSCAELDATAMIQTFMTDTTIVVRFLGMDFAYGFPFYGDYHLSFIVPQMVEKTLVMVAISGGAGSTPILCGGVETEHALELTAQLLGSFLVRLQSCEMMSLPALRRHVHGAIEVGALLCVQDCELAPDAALRLLTACINQVQECLRQQTESPTIMLPLGEGGLPVSVSIDSRFRAAFTTANAETVPLALSLHYRVFYFQRLNNAVAIQAYLTAFGLKDPSGDQCSTTFSIMYEQFREVSPTTFSDAALMAVLRGATLDPVISPALTSDDLMERLLIGFLCVFSPRIREDETLRRLLEWNVKNTIGPTYAVASCKESLDLLALPTSKLTNDELFDGFADMMMTCTNAVVVGAGFSGKTKLWRRWVGSTKYTVFSPSLMTSEDFYGTTAHPGFLASLGKTLLQGTEPHLIVAEDGDLSVNSLWASWPQFSRVPTLEGCFVSSPLTHVLVSARSLRETTPRLASDFGILYVPPPSDWRAFLKDCVCSEQGTSKVAATEAGREAVASPLSDIAVTVFEALVPKVFLAVHPRVSAAALEVKKSPIPGEVTDSAQNGAEGRSLGEDDTNRLFALCQSSTSLYRRWYQYATEQYGRVVGRVTEDYLVDDKAFTAQCAVFAVCWSVGLALEAADQPRVSWALREVEVPLQALAEQYNIADPLLPPSTTGYQEESILRFVATRGGWKMFDEATAYGIGLSWFTHSCISPHDHAWSQRFLLPSRLPVLGAVECLLNCGQSVMLSGSAGSGKSTLLQTIPLSDRWVSQLVSTNKAVNPSFVQEEMAANLSRRSCGRYGPSLGRKLVVCVDDVHLSESVEPGVPLIGRLLAFCNKFSAIVTPSSGFIPTTDVAFLGTTLGRDYNAMVTRSCVQVRLPDFAGAELADGTWKLLEAACGRKRVEGFPRACAMFLTLAHAAFVKLLPSTPTDLFVGSHEGSLEEVHSGGLSPRSNAAVAEGERMLVWRFADALRATEYARQQLLSSSSDVQVATSLFSAVKTLYATSMGSAGAEPEVMVLNTRLAEAAQKTLGTRARDVDFPAIIAQEHRANIELAKRKAPQRRDLPHRFSPSPPAFLGTSGGGFGVDVSDEHRDRVEEWIAEFEITIDEVTEEELGSKFDAKPAGRSKSVGGRNAVSSLLDNIAEGATGGNGEESTAPDGRDASAHRSTLITYAGAAAPMSFGRAGTPSSRHGSVASARNSRRVSVVSGGASLTGGIRIGGGGGSDLPYHESTGRGRGATPSDAAPSRHTVSKTYQTTWLTTLLMGLYRTVHQQSSHVVLIGESALGLNRLLRVFCSVTRKPFTIFRASHESDAFRIARNELRRLVMFAYTNDVRTNAFLPSDFLQISGVLRQVDIIMRSGEINELFSVEERAALARGYRYTHRGVTPLTGAEYVEMRRRVRQNLRFLIQVPSEDALQQLGSEYPAVARVVTIPLCTPELGAALLREVAFGILTEERFGSLLPDGKPHNHATLASDCTSLRLLHSDEKLAETIGEVFEAFAHTHKDARLEQLMEFAREVRRLRGIQLGLVRDGAANAAILMGRADEATEMVTRGTQKAEEVAAELNRSYAAIERLRAQLAQEEKQHQTWDAAATAALEELRADEETLEKDTMRIQESLQKSEKVLAAAATKLRRVKSTLVRSLGAMRLPEKGILLVKAIYRTLNEELPNHGNSPSTLWTLALRYICAPEFPAKLASRTPAEEKDPTTLLALEEGLSGVRYGNASPFAQLIADFILAYMAAVRTRVHITEKDELQKTKDEEKVNTSKGLVEDILLKVDESAKQKAATAKQIEELEAECVEKEALLKQLTEREQYLQRYVGLVDRFSRFISNKQVRERQRGAKVVEASVVLVAAFFSLLSPYTRAGEGYRQIHDILTRRAGLDVATEVDGSCRSLLFPGHEELIAQLTYPELPLRHRVALYGLIRRVSCRWSLYGGVCSTFEAILREHLSFECFGCSVISAHDPTIKDQLVQALREGKGVVLHDADTPAAFGILRELLPLLEQLQIYQDQRAWNAKMDDASGASATERRTKMVGGGLRDDSKRRERAGAGGCGSVKKAVAFSEGVAKLPFRLFGTDIDVHPHFFLVGTSLGTFSSDSASRVADCAHVVNFFTPLPRKMRFRALAARSFLTKASSDVVRERRERFYHELRAFMQAHSAASEMLSTDLEKMLNSDPQAELDKIEGALIEVDGHDGQLAEASAQLQSSGRQVRDAWEPLERPLLASADVLEFIEHSKLRRPWDDRILDDFVATMTALSHDLTARLAPQLFADLPKPEKLFYAMVNYIVSVLSCFACGWPAPVRGLFSLLFLSTVATACEEIGAHRGTLFPRDVELLNVPQLTALKAIVSATLRSDDESFSEGSSVVRQRILVVFRDADDPLLRDLAQELNPAGLSFSEYASTTDQGSVTDRTAWYPAEGHEAACGTNRGIVVECLFRSLADIDFETCEVAALQLCGDFFNAVEDTNAIANRHDVLANETAGSAADGGMGSIASNSAGAIVRDGMRGASRSGTGTSSPSPPSLAAVPSRLSGATDGGSVLLRAPSLLQLHQHQQQQQQLPASMRRARDLLTDSAVARELHSVTAIRQHVAEHGVPLCLPSRIPAMALKALRHRATMDKWVFQWHELRHARTAERVSYEIRNCFHHRPFGRAGHLVALFVDVHESLQEVQQTRDLITQLHRLLTTYQGYRGFLASMVSTGSVPVCLVVVCTPRVDQLLWGCVAGGDREWRRGRCLYLNRDFFTPQAHLLALLRDGTIESGLGSFTTIRGAPHWRDTAGGGGGGGSVARLLRFHDVPGDAGMDSEGSGKRANPDARTPLEVAATLVAKELAVMHVGFAARHAVRLQQWDTTYEGQPLWVATAGAQCSFAPLMPPCLVGTHFNDDDGGLVLLLQLLHVWVQRHLSIVDSLAAAEGPSGGDVADPIALYLANLPPGTLHVALREAMEPYTGRGLTRQAPTGAAGAPNTVTTTSAPLRTGGLRSSSRLRGEAPTVPKISAYTSSVTGSRVNGATQGATASLGMQAYLCYRNQRPLWRLYTNPSVMGIRAVADAVNTGHTGSEKADTATPAAPMPMRPAVTVASLRRNLPTLGVSFDDWRRGAATAASAGPSTSRNVSGVLHPSPPNSYTRRTASLHQLADMLYAVFQKLAYGVYAAGGHSHEDMAAAQRMLATLLVAPHESSGVTVATLGHDSNGPTASVVATGGGGGGDRIGSGGGALNGHPDGDAVGPRGQQHGGTVSCNLTGLDPCCPLTLDTNPNFKNLLADVNGCGGSLMELMGDSEAYYWHELQTRKALARLFFLSSTAAPGAPFSKGEDSRDQEHVSSPLAAAGDAVECVAEWPRSHHHTEKSPWSANATTHDIQFTTDITTATTTAVRASKEAAATIASQFDDEMRDLMVAFAESGDGSVGSDGGDVKEELAPTAQVNLHTAAWQSPFSPGETEGEESGNGVTKGDTELNSVKNSNDAGDHNQTTTPSQPPAAASMSRSGDDCDGSAARSAHNEHVPPPRLLAESNSPAALVLCFEGAALQHLYDTVFNPAVNPQSGPESRMLAARRLVLATTRSLAGCAWQSPWTAVSPHEPPLCLWVPALRRPYATLTLVMRTMEEALDHRTFAASATTVAGGGDSLLRIITSPMPPPLAMCQRVRVLEGEPTLLLLVTKRCLLAPTDILAGGARLSPLLLAEVSRIAGWHDSTHEDGALPAGERDRYLSFLSTGNAYGGKNCDGKCGDRGDETVVAFRFARAIQSRRAHPRTGARRLKSVRFYESAVPPDEVHGSNSRSAQGTTGSTVKLILTTLHAPRLPALTVDGGVGFLWRTPALVRQEIPHGTPALDVGRAGGGTPVLGPRPPTAAPNAPLTAAAAATQDSVGNPSSPVYDPAFVTATDDGDLHSSARARGATPPRQKKLRTQRQYALSYIPVPFYVRALYEDDVHTTTGGPAIPVPSRVETGHSPRGHIAPRSDWRAAVALPVCVLFESAEAAVAESGHESVRPACSKSPERNAATLHHEVNALPVAFPHAGALGFHIVCDW